MSTRPARAPLRIMPTGRTGAEDLEIEVERGRRGDLDAFGRIYGRCVDRVNLLCRRMTQDSVLADQLTQDVFVKAWDRLHTFRGDSQFTTWLHRIAVRTVHDERRRASRHVRLRDALKATPPPGQKHRHLADRIDLDRAVAQLPERARTVFLLHDAEGYTHEEIGEILGISDGTSKSTLHRARLLLRKKLDT